MEQPKKNVIEVTTSDQHPFVDAFRRSFQDAVSGVGEMSDSVYRVEGFCGRRFRLFLNNLIRNLDGRARYLEVGVFKGATLCAAIAGNRLTATAIDDWTWDQDGTVAATFRSNLAAHQEASFPVRVLESEFRKMPAADIGPFNVYFYDGNHSEKDQYDAMTWGVEALDDVAIVLVDDWNWERVRKGTFNGLRNAGAKILYMLELRTSFDDQIPSPAYGGSDWHNGFFGCVISRS